MEPAKAVVAAFVEALERLGGILEMGRQIDEEQRRYFLDSSHPPVESLSIQMRMVSDSPFWFNSSIESQ